MGQKQEKITQNELSNKILTVKHTILMIVLLLLFEIIPIYILDFVSFIYNTTI